MNSTEVGDFVAERLVTGLVGKIVLNVAPGGAVLPWIIETVKAREMEKDAIIAAEYLLKVFNAIRVEIHSRANGSLDRVEIVRES